VDSAAVDFSNMAEIDGQAVCVGHGETRGEEDNRREMAMKAIRGNGRCEASTPCEAMALGFGHVAQSGIVGALFRHGGCDGHQGGEHV
jgi:hypothetical protein